MISPLIAAGSAGFISDAACFAVGAITLDQLGALHGMEPEQVLTALADPGIGSSVDRVAAEFERDGSATRMRARSLLGDAVRTLADTVEQGACSPTFLLRLTEVLGKLAADPKDEKQDPAAPTFHISIDLGDRSVTLTAARAQGQPTPMTLDACTGALECSP
jgi:hypothetical protein